MSAFPDVAAAGRQARDVALAALRAATVEVLAERFGRRAPKEPHERSRMVR